MHQTLDARPPSQPAPASLKLRVINLVAVQLPLAGVFAAFAKTPMLRAEYHF